VSPSWGEHIEVFLGPRGVRIARAHRGLRRRADPERLVETDGAPGWPAALEALGRALPMVGEKSAEVRTVVSNHFVRYTVLPGAEQLSSVEERLALARHQFQSIHGERAAGWRVALAEHGSRASSLAAALDAEMLDAIVAKLTAAGHAPRSVEPLLAAAFNACRSEIGRGSAWVAVAEPGRLCVGYLENQRWLKVRNGRASRAPEAELAVVLEQMRLTAGAAPGQVYFVSHDAVEPTPSVAPGWTVYAVRLGAEAAREAREAA